jgi:hypothetical protein
MPYVHQVGLDKKNIDLCIDSQSWLEMNRQRQQQREAGQQQPRDAKIISLLLQSHGVHDFDPKVVHQLLEFAHRTSILSFRG